MNKKRIITSIVLILMLSFTVILSACGKDGQATLELSSASLRLGLFDQTKVSATAAKDGVEVADAEITWKTSEPGVAIVANDGTVTPVSAGTAVITASWLSQTATCGVTVFDDGERPVLSVSDNTVSLLSNNTEGYKLSALVRYGKADTSTAQINWSVKDGGDVIAVGADGHITVKGVGNATILAAASWNGYSGYGMAKEIGVSVFDDVDLLVFGGKEVVYTNAVTVDGIDFSDKATFEATVKADGKNVDSPLVNWVTSDASIAEINDNGVLSGKKEGSVKVWFEYSNKGQTYASARQEVFVEFPTVNKIDSLEFSFDKSKTTVLSAKDVFGDDYAGSITAVYDSQNKTNIITAGTGTIKLNDFEGERTFEIRNSDNYGYKVTALVATKIFSTGSEFVAFRKANVFGTMNASVKYNYGYVDVNKNGVYDASDRQAYYILADDIVIESLVSGGTYREASIGGWFDDGNGMSCGFHGVFDGRGHTVTFTNVNGGIGKGGLFGDLGANSVIKNLGVIGKLNTGVSKAAALGMICHGATIDNCYFDIDDNYVAGSENYRGLIFASAHNLIMTNTVIYGKATTSPSVTRFGMLASYFHNGQSVQSFKSVLAVSKNPTNGKYARWLSKVDSSAFLSDGVTQVDGSAEDFSIVDYKLTGFSTDGFNSKYFLMDKDRIPLFGKNSDSLTLSKKISGDAEIYTATAADGETFSKTTLLELEVKNRGTVIDGLDVTWSSSDSDVATVSADGLVSAKIEGIVTITAAFEYNGKGYTDEKIIVVTCPTLDKTSAIELLLDKSAGITAPTATEIFGLNGGTITAIYDSKDMTANILSGNTLLLDTVDGERIFVIRNDRGYAYKVSAVVATKVFKTGSEFTAFRTANVVGKDDGKTLYNYGYVDTNKNGKYDGEDRQAYYALANNITISSIVTGGTYRANVGGLSGFFGNDDSDGTTCGFHGVFDGRGYTITLTHSDGGLGRGGLFGDLGANAVIKNLGVVGKLNKDSGHRSALASIGFGATIDNCYFDIEEFSTTATSTNTYRGLLFSAVKSITMTNSIVYGLTTNDTVRYNSGLFSSYHTSADNATFSFSNVLAISKNAFVTSRWMVGSAGDNGSNFLPDDVKQINGSDSNFDIKSYELVDFNTSSFGKYFTLSAGRIPLWTSVYSAN